MRRACKRCGVATPPGGIAKICSFECTFCEPCANAMQCICPNCGGELVARPRRIVRAEQ